MDGFGHFTSSAYSIPESPKDLLALSPSSSLSPPPPKVQPATRYDGNNSRVYVKAVNMSNI